ncbi:MAG: universal stress protein [Deltaproteobacteria bacterium]|nr:universal stress protein [Deltaproteobacteria bacterium]MCW5807935.1 universal stress protein [Deltaproteobacteria bacterium]
MVPSNILVPTDLSERAERALDYACDLAARLDATVHLVHVIAVPATSVPELGVALASTMIDALVDDDQRALDNLADSRRSRCRIGERILTTGDARDAICETAKELGVDLIVMGTHGRRGLVRALLGSVAESVVRSAPCPVLTVCAPDHAHRDAA